MADLGKVEICRIPRSHECIILILSGGNAGGTSPLSSPTVTTYMGMADHSPSEVNRSTNTPSGRSIPRGLISGLANYAPPDYAGTPANIFLSVGLGFEGTARPQRWTRTAIFRDFYRATSGSQTNGTPYCSAKKRVVRRLPGHGHFIRSS